MTEDLEALIRRVVREELGTPRGPFLTTAQAAEYCATTEGSLRTLMSERQGPRHYKHGRKNVFVREDLDAWMASRLIEGVAT